MRANAGLERKQDDQVLGVDSAVGAYALPAPRALRIDPASCRRRFREGR